MDRESAERNEQLMTLRQGRTGYALLEQAVQTSVESIQGLAVREPRTRGRVW